METQENTSAEQAQEMTVDQLIDYFRNGHGPVGAHQIVAQLDAAVAENETLHAQLSEAEAAADDAQVKIDDLTAKLEVSEAKAKAAKLSAGEKAVKPRKVGLVRERLSIDDLKAVIAKAGKVEILFGDGTKESGPAPVLVEGDAWADHALGLMLKEPVVVHGPAHGAAPYQIKGYALFVDGKQVAWSERPDPLQVGAGQKYQLSNDIFF